MKKKKQIEIIDAELTPTTLAVKKDTKKVNAFGIVWIALIFAILIGGVIYLPDISLYINNYLNPEVSVPSTSNKVPNKEEESEEKETVNIYNIGDTSEVLLDKIKVNNVTISNSKISFLVTNTSQEMLKLKDYNYFMNLYDNNKKLVQRIMFASEVLSPNASISLEYDLMDDTSVKYSIVSINTSDYPAYVVDANADKSAELVCKKGYETITYLLNDNKTYGITISEEVPITDPNFNNLYSTYEALKVTYNAYEGVTSSVNVTDQALIFRTIINLSEVGTSLNLKAIYPNNTDAKIMHFELTASGYTC